MNRASSVTAVALVAMLVFPSFLTATMPTVIEPLPDTAFRPIKVEPYEPPSPESSPQPPSGLHELRAAETATPTRAPIAVPKPRPVVIVAKKPVETKPTKKHFLLGLASWYCQPGASICTHGFPSGGSFAAAGPKLRVAICGSTSCTSYKGRVVYVNNVRVTLVDYCQCYWNTPQEKLIDLYHVVFAQTGSKIVIRW